MYGWVIQPDPPDRDPTIDLNLLRVLDALLAERSVTRAARRLHLTQSAVSHALARLRVALGDPLLVREGATMRPTAEGERLATEVHEIMRRVRTHIAPVGFAPATTRRSFAIGVPDAITVHVALPVLAAFAALAPHASLQLRRLTPATADELAAGAIDAAISVAGYLPEELRSAAVLRVRWQAVVSARHALARREFALIDTAAWPHVAAIDSPINERIDRTLQTYGLRRTTAVLLSTAALVTAVVAQSELVGFVPEHEQVGAGLWTSQLGDDAPVLDYFLYPSSAHAGDAGHEWFIATLVSAVGNAVRPPP